MILFASTKNGLHMKKFIVITLSVILLTAFIIASSLGYSLLVPGNSNLIANFAVGLTGFSKMFCIFVISFLIIFAVVVIISSVIYFFTNDSTVLIDNPRDNS